jgi:phosphoglycerol transferase MdoB-like AlkP superfamily enzyme
MEQEIETLKKRVAELEAELELTKQHLKKYTAPNRNKKYYEENKDIILEKNKLYKEKTNYNENITSEKRKEYNKRAYEKRKEKLKQENNKLDNIN